MEETIKIEQTSEAVPVPTADVPVGHLEKSDKKANSDKSDKRIEKLSALKEKYEKAAAVQAAAEKKTKEIFSQISKIEKDLKAEKIAELEKVCGKDIDITEITGLVKVIKKAELSVSEVIELIGGTV
ncbi:MAG: hypothetical protein ACI4I1_10205 [Oscillospiraceae bacterium]